MNLSISKKFIYFLSCIVLTFFLFGCKEKGKYVSVFDGLPESTYLNELKSALESKKPLAIAFIAEWCPHCRKYKPIFLEVKDSYKDNVTFLDIDVDDINGSPISNRFQVKGIPTTAFVRQDGSVFKIQVGEIGKEDLINIIDDLLKNRKKRRREPIAPFPIEPYEVKPAPPEEKIQEEVPQELIKEEEPSGTIEEERPQEVKPEGLIEQGTEDVDTTEKGKLEGLETPDQKTQEGNKEEDNDDSQDLEDDDLE